MWILALFILVWVVTWAAWLTLSRAVRRSDIDRISSRLLGSAKGQNTKASENQSLLQEERQAGKVIAHLLKKYNLLPRLQQLIEQAGRKWHPVRVVHSCLGLFILAFFRLLDCSADAHAAPCHIGRHRGCHAPGAVSASGSDISIAAFRGAVPGEPGVRRTFHAGGSRLRRLLGDAA
jgi:hypothetical protein